MIEQQLYLDGAWQEGAGTPREVHDTWTGEVVGHYAVAAPEQVTVSITAAQTAMDVPWPAHERAATLRRAAALMAERSEELADLLRREAGKPITAARAEVARCVQTLSLSAAEASRITGESLDMSVVPGGEDVTAYTLTQGVGVVGAITPFNFPLNLVAHKIGPALAAGCAVVLKPSERTPLAAGALVRILHEAGLPPGRLNMVTGDPAEVVGRLIEDDRVEVLTFTGSAQVGWDLKARSPRKRHVLELGSNTAALVMPDADLDLVVNSVISAAFAFSGQACVSLQRLYVHEEQVEALVEQLRVATEALGVGDPAREDVTVGPLISSAALERVEQWVDEAVSAGARLVTGGRREGRALRPTILADVPASARVVCDEVFGPVVSVISVPDADAGIRSINESRFGLNAAVFTRDLGVAMRCTREIEAGSVLVNLPPAFRTDNMPYGGVKDSGQGREGVAYAVAELLEERLVLIAG
ncbi:aldehyde dehydrogenase family protein [uncultured Serinicoccus sp.]|uniref:aldehyde dehydrogenase family protein n=1 Tax=uncultured Serinicoccus sp. TaxID=735514 RepID=UPI00262B7116|nr:aldehyde dehydrogenase family protein [uncultured Serinicoccus sp.]